MVRGDSADMNDEITEVPSYLEDIRELTSYLRQRDIVFEPLEGDAASQGPVKFSLPEGRESRRISIFGFAARAVQEASVADWQFSTEYDSIFNRKTGEVEVRVALPNRAGKIVPIWELPGVEKNLEFKVPESGEFELDPQEDIFSVMVKIGANSLGFPLGWEIALEGENYSLRLGPASKLFLAINGGFDHSYLTMKIHHHDGDLGPHADALVGGLGRDFLTELDFVHGVGARVAVYPIEREGDLWSFSKQTPSLPRNSYEDQPKSLYWYGVGAEGLPLVQFLAFYQILEFYFPRFNREVVISRLRNRLNDPGFDVSDDSHLSRLVDTTASAHLGKRNELDQLRTTLLACVESSDLGEFFRSAGREDHFLRSRQVLKGVSRIDSARDLHEQVAERVYRIRNRIVHSKDLETGSGMELLLPSGEETRAMGPEVLLVRLLARKAMIYGSRPSPSWI